MLRYAYGIFASEASLNDNQQISAKDFFSHLTLRKPGTTKMSFVVGVWGFEKGETASVRLEVVTPSDQKLTGKWITRNSKDEIHVQSAIFNVSKIPFEVEGIYKFLLYNNDTEELFGERYLKVTFSQGGETYE